MKKNVYNEIRFKNTWVNYGYSIRRLALGFSIDRYSITINFLWFWISIEL